MSAAQSVRTNQRENSCANSRFVILAHQMAVAANYLQEVQKFTSSQYWYSGLRITAGVMVPLIVLIWQGWVSVAVPFLWGALFVSLTDTPGPIQHRRNGMVAAVLLNTFVVLLTTITRQYQPLVISQIILLGFLLTMLSVYGARAGAVGTLALVVMLLNFLTTKEEYNPLWAPVLIAGGGLWYASFSMLLHGIRPYRAVEQAVGEHLIKIADYVRARAAFYREGTDLDDCFHRLMRTQSDVRALQNQTQDLLFKTRRFVVDASPKSRSLMMIYLDSLDLFEQTMYAYQDYERLHKSLGKTGLLNRLYGLILELAAGLEHIGITVQMGNAVRTSFDVNKRIAELRDSMQLELGNTTAEDHVVDLQAFKRILNNVQGISNRMNRLILYTRMEVETDHPPEVAERVSRVAAGQPIRLKTLTDNLTFKSDTFRHAIRLTVAIAIGYALSLVLSLQHSYWVLLTIVTILRPAYVITKRRNVQRVTGTLVGVAIVLVLLWFISSSTILLAILVISMLLGYSLLRVHYFTFVVFLTIFLVISLHFLNPLDFQMLIRERLVDTVIGSVIAFLVSRFLFPVWEHREIRQSMMKMLEANRQYFYQAWSVASKEQPDSPAYDLARQEAIVSLTNLSDNFQSMLSEPDQPPQASAIHQFVIANHMLTGHIAALSGSEISPSPEMDELVKAISYELQCAEDNLRDKHARTDLSSPDVPAMSIQSLSQLSMIYSLAHDLRRISARFTGS